MYHDRFHSVHLFSHCQVVVTNQITTRFVGLGTGAGNPLKSSEAFEDVDGADAEPEEDDGSHVTAALGNTWSHAVNTRLIVQYLDDKFRQVKAQILSRFLCALSVDRTGSFPLSVFLPLHLRKSHDMH